MHKIKFWLIGIASFIITTVTTVFVSGSFLNRLLLVTSCAVFELNSNFCTPSLEMEFGSAIAVTPEFEITTSSNGASQKYPSIQPELVRSNYLAQSQTKDSSEAAPVYAFFINGVLNSSDDYDQSRALVRNLLSAAGITANFPYYTYNPWVGSTIKNDIGDALLKFINNSLINKVITIVNAPSSAIGSLHRYFDIFTETPRQYVYQFYREAWTDSIDNKLRFTNNAEFSGQIVDDIKLIDNVAGCREGEQKKHLQPKFIVIAHSQGTMYAAQIARSLPPEIAKRTVVLAFSPFIRDTNDLNGVHFGYVLRSDDFATLAPFRKLQPNLEPLPVKKTADLEIAWSIAKIGTIPNDIPDLVCNRSNECYRIGAPLESHALQNYLDPINSEYPKAATTAFNFSVNKLKQLIDFPVTEYATTCPPISQGGSGNDPHLTTFDGLKYDLQTVGEFILMKSSSGAFEVQVRQTPYNKSASLSINSAVTMRVGGDRVAFYAQGFPDADTTTPLRVNGKPTTIQDNKLALQGGGEILKQGRTYVVSAPTGEKVLVSPSSSFLNISPIVHNRSGKYSGLLGNVNGNPNDDLQIRGGSNVLAVKSTYGDVNKVLNLVGLRSPGLLDRAEQVYFDQLYKQFANSWRVKQEESLFDYPPGKTTKSYVNPSFPDKYLTLNMLSADQIQKARNACTEAKVTQDLMEGCIFDVGFSGFSEFARTTAEITGYVNTVNQLFPGLRIPTPERAVDRVIQQVKPRICLPIVGCH